MIDDFAKSYLHDELRDHRAILLKSIEGLSDYDIRRPLTPTGTNLLGMVKHRAWWESIYLGEIFDRPFPENLGFPSAGEDHWVRADETRQSILDWYRRTCDHGDATIEALPIDAPGHVPWWPRPDVKLFNVLVHLVTESARHAGHADIIREQLEESHGIREGTSARFPLDEAFWSERYATIEAAARAAASSSSI